MLPQRHKSGNRRSGQEVKDIADILARGYLRHARLTQKSRNVAVSERGEPQKALDVPRPESPDRVGDSAPMRQP